MGRKADRRRFRTPPSLPGASFCGIAPDNEAYSVAFVLVWAAPISDGRSDALLLLLVSPAERTTLLVSRATVRSECRFRALGETVNADPRLLMIAPSLIATRSGEVVSMHSGFLWPLTRHIDGLHPSPNDAVI